MGDNPSGHADPSVGRVSAMQTHAVPVFRGRESRSHQRLTIPALQAAAAAELARGGIGGHVSTFVQFAGFPRSGHSILGSILDAHPDAMVAHELDTMGLVRAGLETDEIFALIRANTRAFEAAGRYWNGFCYAVPGGHGGNSDTPRVLGDKKAD